MRDQSGGGVLAINQGTCKRNHAALAILPSWPNAYSDWPRLCGNLAVLAGEEFFKGLASEAGHFFCSRQ